MELIEKKENQMTFKANIDESIANAIRRYVNQILVLAIDEVEIFKNDSPLYDETIAHRMGLIPLKMDSTMDEKTTANLKLVSKKTGAVLSKELSGKVKVVYDNIPITILGEGQELEIVGHAKMGKGVEHSKFSPGLIFYRNISEVIMDKEFLSEVKKICPQADVKERGDKIIVIDNKKESFCDVCEGICKEKGKNAETKLTNELMITIDSFGQMEVKDIFKKSLSALKKDFNELGKKIDKI